jgi:hypothetical protein
MKPMPSSKSEGHVVSSLRLDISNSTMEQLMSRLVPISNQQVEKQFTSKFSQQQRLCKNPLHPDTTHPKTSAAAIKRASQCPRLSIKCSQKPEISQNKKQAFTL